MKWVVFLGIVTFCYSAVVEQVKVDTTNYLYPLNPYFLGAGWEINAFLDSVYYLNVPAFRKVVSHLGPGVLRVGGISADMARYTFPTDTPEKNVHVGSYWPTPRDLPVRDFKNLVSLANEANLQFLFTLNELYGRDCNNTRHVCSGNWDTSNLREFLTYVKNNNIGPIHGFELGNELTYPTDRHITLTENIADYETLNNIINSIWPQKQERPPIYGPSTDYCNTDTETFMIATKAFLKGYTYHSYPARGDVKKDLISLQWLKENIVIRDLQANSSHCIQAWNAIGKPIGMELWITETNSGGEIFNVTNAFENSFWYTSSIGQYASAGIARHCRWDLFGNDPFPFFHPVNGGFAAYPDYWVAVLFKQVVGTKVLSASSAFSHSLVYAFCGKTSGSVTLMYVNPENTQLTLELSGFNISGTRQEYIFTATSLGSVEMILNGKPLAINKDGSITPLNPHTASGNILLPAYSLGYLVFPQAAAQVCK